MGEISEFHRKFPESLVLAKKKKKKSIGKAVQQSQLERKQRGRGGGLCTEEKCDEIACVLEASPIMIIVMTMQLWLYIVL